MKTLRIVNGINDTTIAYINSYDHIPREGETIELNRVFYKVSRVVYKYFPKLKGMDNMQICVDKDTEVEVYVIKLNL